MSIPKKFINTCKVCGITKPREEFPYCGGCTCIICFNIRRREDRKNNPDHYRQSEQKAYYRNRDVRLVQNKKYRDKNVEILQIKSKDYRLKNKERIAESARERAKRNPDIPNKNKRAYKMRKRAAGYIDRVIINFILERDYGICSYCLKPGKEVDHIVPISKGGTNEINNLTTACRTCNATKSNKSLLEYLRYTMVCK